MNVLPVDLTQLLAITLGMLTVLIPVAGLTARFALKPVVEAIARARESRDLRADNEILEKRVALLEQQIQGMERSLDRLVEESEFARQLAAPNA